MKYSRYRDPSGPSGTVHSASPQCHVFDNTIPALTSLCAVYPGAPERPKLLKLFDIILLYYYLIIRSIQARY